MIKSSDRRVWVQSREDLNFPTLVDFGNNRYGLQFTRGRHAGGEWLHFLISEDGCQTWMDDRARREVTYHGFHIMRRRDGSLFGISADNEHKNGVFFRQIVSYDHGRSWAESWEPAIGCGGFGHPNCTPWNPPIELRDGRLLIACYGKDLSGKQQNRKDEVIVVERKADETIWRAKSNVFGPHPDTREGPNEASLVVLPDGKIGCVARTGYPDSPLLWACSDDDGQTWSEPKRLPWSGVDPSLYLTGNGQLVLVFGARRAEKLTGCMTAASSPDGGKTWSDPFVFYDGPGSSYHTGARTGPDRLLVTYSEGQFRRLELPQFTPPDQYNRICAQTLTVTQ